MTAISPLAEFEALAATVVSRNAGRLLDDGPEVQIARAVERLQKFHSHTPLEPIADVGIDLAGFGQAQLHFAAADDQYLLLSEVAEQLGWPIWDACKWARNEHLLSLEEQRDQDEERGDGRLGWDCLTDYVDLGFWFHQDNPEAGGRKTSDYGDWMISTDRVMLAILDSPWGAEFKRNIGGLMRHAFQATLADGPLGDVPTYTGDGDQTGLNLRETLRPEMSEEEAIRRAQRGPAIPDEKP